MYAAFTAATSVCGLELPHCVCKTPKRRNHAGAGAGIARLLLVLLLLLGLYTQ